MVGTPLDNAFSHDDKKASTMIVERLVYLDLRHFGSLQLPIMTRVTSGTGTIDTPTPQAVGAPLTNADGSVVTSSMLAVKPLPAPLAEAVSNRLASARGIYHTTFSTQLRGGISAAFGRGPLLGYPLASTAINLIEEGCEVSSRFIFLHLFCTMLYDR